MKKIFSLFLSVMMLTAVLSANIVTVQASEAEDNVTGVVISETVEYFEDGSYATITVTEEPTTARATSSKSGSKYYLMRNSDGEELFRLTVHGTFSVNSGVSATCTAASRTYSISDDAWQVKTTSVSKSGNTATANGTFVRKLLGITIETQSCTVTLTCDKYGNLS